jgi:phosphohistidine phosphatase
MKTLHLLRHAKSAWDDPGLADHDRPLSARGRAAADAVGRRMAADGIAADLVLCSTAVRARQTLERVRDAWDGARAAETDPGLYLCGPAGLLARIRSVPDAVGSLMLVGHNPDTEELALMLCASGEDGLLGALREKYPTGALATIALDVGGWADADRGRGRLVRFLRPRDLGA